MAPGSLPFGTSVFGQEIADATGLPLNALAPTLHYADIAYLVGFVVSLFLKEIPLRDKGGTHAADSDAVEARAKADTVVV